VKRQLLIGILSLTALTGGCMNQTKAPPPLEFHPISINNFARTWTVDLGMRGANPTDVFLFDGVIIVYGDDNTAHVVNRQSGRLMYIHSLPTRAGTMHSPGIVGDLIIYPATSAIKCYSVKTGQLVRQYQVPFAIRTGVTGLNNFYYLSADYPNGGRLVALDVHRTDTLPRWEIMTTASIRANPVLYQGSLFFAAQDGTVRAVSEERGMLWQSDDYYDGAFKASGAIVANIRVDESAVYVASADSKLYALNRGNGKIKWQYFTGVPLDEAPFTTNDTCYIHVKGQGLIAIGKLEGDYNRKPKWISAESTKFLADDDKYTYVLLDSNQVAALEKATGQIKFKSTRNDLTQFGVNQKDGLVYATDRSGNLLQIKPVIKQGVVGELVLDTHPLDPSLIEVASR